MPDVPLSHNCRLCGRSYERADHLNRHLKSHENARPHRCTRCQKSFNRADLLSRHEAAHQRPAGPLVERTDRVAVACTACVASKSKCQDEKPCSRCRKKQIVCKVGDDPVHPPSPPEARPSVLPPGQTEAQPDTELHLQSEGQPWGHANQTNRPSGQLFDIQPRSAPDSYHNVHQAAAIPFSQGLHPLPNETFHDLAYSRGALGFGGDLEFLPPNSMFSQDFDYGLRDIDLDGMEMAYQSLDGSVVPQTETPPENSERTNRNKNVSKQRLAAFKRSPWLWTPTPRDRTLNDHSALELDEEHIPPVLLASPGASSNEYSSCCLDSRMRDKMLLLPLSIRDQGSQTMSLPSLSLLNSIIQVFFIQESLKTDSFIHIPTFKPEKALPQLFLALVSAGATLISVPSVWKLGFALQEVARHNISIFWESNNSNTRNIQALQAFVTCVNVGLWSGLKRKMEIAESIGQPIIIILRRAGVLGTSHHMSMFAPTQDDSAAVLEAKWERWAEQESFKRLALHVFINDMYTSCAFQKPPLISFSELKLDLPFSHRLWSARSSSEWRDLYVEANCGLGTYPTFTDIMRDPQAILPFEKRFDLSLCALTVLQGFWGQIWGLWELKRLSVTKKAAHGLSVLTLQDELYRDVSEFQDKFQQLHDITPTITFICELYMMMIYISPGDIQRFAGKLGEEEASQAANELRTWCKTSDACITVWHAGQVLRAAKMLMPARLRDFFAIGVYYAALTIWTYGIMRADLNLEPEATNAVERNEYVLLNDAPTPQTQGFRLNGKGLPAILMSDVNGDFDVVPVVASDRILTVTQQLFRNNFALGDEVLPPLLQSLAQLMLGLGSFSWGRSSRAGSEAVE